MEITTIEIVCANCKVPFWITDGMDDRLRDSHQIFYCPSGHVQFYPAKTETERLSDALRDKNNELEQVRKELRKKCRPKRKPRTK